MRKHKNQKPEERGFKEDKYNLDKLNPRISNHSMDLKQAIYIVEANNSK